jgi:hypothetical protein
MRVHASVKVHHFFTPTARPAIGGRLVLQDLRRSLETQSD